ncbi:Mesentericin-Y105 transport/processing ATP-binding protein MesD [Leuconostoc gasicomitatum]|uniref:peptide cleavage/export ABC transporter n=1 Tax=Leuconostoc gasicomitatum TaxID=115778 RepID=UPI000BC78EF5|nr:peptide cleavage/export ABC transporter [Leuconostoc gasicomitatum]MBZ5952235.1 peptide cleavage/export ABC transporter [Leuconostoc gasicomitatum]MBZ5968715.1 peptide cleavage/export ABC transporter [Leuconostoc gasicomitatum]MBZ5970843.1 peptide cleavage/export ABC transporter [Leuconostoc gasicomitatum]QFS15739.1 peptide ABC transporter ATP-binding protein [Leuconostoc gasicomitatum]SOC14619.1 Mesentericin-Y105 transport/processing ATP-binding protein MesD [Leuconostoc gasicomitatum]
MFIKKINYIPQVDERDCGVAALAMIMAHYNTRMSLAQLREMAKTDMEGTTALGIVKAAQALDFDTMPVQADLSMFDKKDLPYPFIAHVQKDGKYPHYYVVYGMKGQNLLIADPDITVGRTKMAKSYFVNEWTGVAIFIAPNPIYKPTKDKKRSLSSFIPVIGKQRGLVINIVIAALMVTLVSILGSYYLQGIIDTYIPDNMKSTLGIVSVGLIVAYVIQQMLSYARDYLLIIMGQRLSIDIILSYIKHIFELPMSFFATRRTGEIISRFTDANSIIEALASTMLSLFLDVGILVIVGTVLVIQNSTLFFISLVAVPAYSLVIWLFMKPFSKMNNDQMQAGSMLSASIIEDINGVETIKALNSEQVAYKKVDHEFVTYLDKSFIYAKTEAVQNALKSLLHLILNVLVLWVGAQLVMANKISMGQLITYNALLGFFTDPLQNIINLQTKLQQASVANNRLNEVYLVESEYKEPSALSERIADASDIIMTQVTYKYGFGAPAIDDVSLQIGQGEKIALVGVSGSGKSTLVKLLVNFFHPESGTIMLGNSTLENIDKHELRAHINYLPQEPYIFTGSIIENLMLGAKPSTTQADIIRATELAEIKIDIENMSQGFSTELAESGNISGGQKQRIALARALLVDSPVLILDESTSNLDVLTEKKIIDNLMKLTDKTIIFVAHRLTISQKVQRIIAMQSGKIIEDGSHDELLEQAGFYASLFND